MLKVKRNNKLVISNAVRQYSKKYVSEAFYGFCTVFEEACDAKYFVN